MAVRRVQHLQQRLIEQAAENLVALLKCFPERGLGFEQRASHADVLRALAGKQEGNPWCNGQLDPSRLDARRLVSIPQALQALVQFRGIPRHDRRTMIEVRSAGIGGPADIGRQVRLDALPDTRRNAPQASPRRIRSSPDIASRCSGRSAASALAGVAGAASSSTTCVFVPPKPKELTPAIRVGPAGCQGERFGRDSQSGTVQPQVRVRRLKVRLRRDHTVLHHEHHLDDPRDAGDRFRVPDIRLDGRDVQRRLVIVAAEDFGQSQGLDGVAQRRPRAVRFDVTDAVTGQARLSQRRADHRLLRPPAGGRDPRGASILVGRRTANHRPHRIAVPDGVRQPLEDDHPAPFASNVAVGTGIEGPAAAIR